MSKDKELEQEELNQQETIATEDQTTEAQENTEQEEKDPIQVLEAQLLEEKSKYLRLYADFENFRKQKAKERIDLIQTAGASVVSNLIPVIDDFDRASANNDKVDDINAVKEGFELIKNKFVRILNQSGLKEMENLVGAEFDVDHHEALTKIPAPSDKLKGKIVDVAEKGYYLNDKVIRFAKVIIGE